MSRVECFQLNPSEEQTFPAYKGFGKAQTICRERILAKKSYIFNLAVPSDLDDAF
jgi:hypothetical protein